MKKTLLLTIGVPGSGKTTYANRVMKKLNSMFGLRVAGCSADEFFIDKRGVYNFNRDKLGAAHGYCKDMARKYMRSGTDLVVVHNTNTTHKERLPYIEMAKEWQYRVVLRYIGGLDEESLQKYHARNLHGVPMENIKKMAERIQGGKRK